MKRSLNRSRLISILLLSLVLYSCRTVRESSRTATDFRRDVVSKVDETKNTVVDSSTAKVEANDLTSIDSTVTRIVDVYLSAPDSAGVQYPVRITSINTEELKATVEHALKVFQTNNRKSEDYRSKARKADHTTDEAVTSNKESKKPPDALFLFIAVVVAGIIEAAYFLLPWKDLLKRISKLFK